MLEAPETDRPFFFACYFSEQCLGVKQGSIKLVTMPLGRVVFYLDLAADPGEEDPQKLDANVASLAAGLRVVAGSMRNQQAARSYEYGPPLKLPNGWECPAGDGCRHPNSPPGFFHEPPKNFY